MLNTNWGFHLTRLIITALLVTMLGWWFGHPWLFAGIFALAYLGWLMFNSLRLYKWLRSTEENPPESLGMWADIFDRIAGLQKQTRKRNRRYQEAIDDLRGMADALPDATLVIDENDAIRWFNDSTVKLLDLVSPDDKGQIVTNLIRDPAFADWLPVSEQLLSTLEVPCPTDDSIMLQISAIRFRRNLRLLILRDVTDVHNLAQVRHDLVANVSHELRTPLTVLLGYLEILETQDSTPDTATIGRMLKQARHMRTLLDDLLELSRLQDTGKQDDTVDVDIPVMIAQLAEQAEDLSQGRHKLQFRTEPGLKLRGVEADLKSAFQNLVVNAINYTPPKGSIKVDWRETPEGLLLSVKDNGVGIPRRDLPRITERFYRVGDDRSRKTGGTGLGLAIVKHVLNTHDATLDIHSEVGQGSEFRCLFPLERKA